MDLSPDIQAAFLSARKVHAAGRLLEAESMYRNLAVPGKCRALALEALAELYMQQQRYEEASSALRALTLDEPDNLHFCRLLANFRHAAGETAAAIGEYSRFLGRQPDNAEAHFNQAWLYTKVKQYAQALAAYEKAIENHIEQAEEAYCNMGVIYSDMQEPEIALHMYQRALEIAPDYTAALFNLAGHLEETNEKQKALEAYERVLAIDATHWNALARLAYPQKIDDEHRNLIERLELAIAQPKDDKLAQEGLYFALGKAFDDLQEYDRAAAAYVAANALGKQRGVAYAPAKTEQGFDKLIDYFNADWIARNASDSTATPVFICGMFRSGSTLLEQMLAAHPSITAGGEIEVLPWLIGSELAPFPEGVRNASRAALQQVGNKYLEAVRKLFPDYEYLTDKRPDNYLHLGLIKALFPNAKIIHTRRGLLDNCLSLYFQQLGGSFSYATDLEHTAHYIHQHDRLMAHWRACLGADIVSVQYEELVQSPEAIMRRLLDYLDLAWDDRVLSARRSGSPVKTPSLWQVREKLHTRSSGRWRHYETLLQGLRERYPA